MTHRRAGRDGLFAGARGAAVALALVLSAWPSPSQADGPRFAVYGDMPYDAADQDFLDGPASLRLADSPAIAFVLAVGDLGRPDDACDDAWQARQRALWRNGFGKPVFLTPGDNDWTDCDRAGSPSPVSELGRLDALRRMHFATPPPFLDARWRYRAQPGQPENATWSTAGVRFATVHMVGTDNGRRAIELDDRTVALALADARDSANLSWIAETFRVARAEEAAAVVIAMHVDPFSPGRNRDRQDTELALTRCLANPAYAPVCRELALQALTFPRPVLLVHGDTNPACLEAIESADGRRLFWRLNAWGDFSQPPEMAVVDVDPADPARPFKVSGLVGDRPIPASCRY